MDLQRTVNDALNQRDEVSGLACIDAESGMVISAAARDDDAAELLTGSADCAGDLCTLVDAEAADETFVVGNRWMHVLVRAPERPTLVVVGVAPAAGNLALLASCTREVARAVGR